MTNLFSVARLLLLFVVFSLASACANDLTAPQPAKIKPQYTTAGKWCPVMDMNGQLFWVWFENGLCPPFHPPGS